jgi:hypothetical protein
MDWKGLSDFIKDVGFPIAVTVALLYQFFVMHDANIKAIHDLITEIALLRAELAKRPNCQSFHPTPPQAAP